MTLLDRALIKAYTETGYHGAAGNRGREETPVAAPQRIQSSKSMLRPPELPRGAKQAIASASEMAREQHGGDSRAHTLGSPSNSPHGAVAPLSKFAPSARPHESFRAMLEVDHLAWPEACEGLLIRARAEWDAFAARLARQVGRGTQCIGLTSIQRGEGRTTVALAMAKVLAARGLRTVVVDADFDCPNLVESCGISAQAGWSDVLSGELSLGETLIAAAKDRVTLLPWHGARTRTAHWDNTLPIASSFSMLRDQYDLIVLDTMPLDSAAAVSELANLAEAVRMDAVYLIFDARSTPASSLTDMCARLRQAGLGVEGLIENFGSALTSAEMAGPSYDPTVLKSARHNLEPTN